MSLVLEMADNSRIEIAVPLDGSGDIFAAMAAQILQARGRMRRFLCDHVTRRGMFMEELRYREIYIAVEEIGEVYRQTFHGVPIEIEDE